MLSCLVSGAVLQAGFDAQVGLQPGSLQQQQSQMQGGIQMAPQNIQMQQQYMHTSQQMVPGVAASYAPRSSIVVQQQQGVVMAPRMPGAQVMMQGPMLQQQQVLNGQRALAYNQHQMVGTAPRPPRSTYGTPPKLHHIDQQTVYSQNSTAPSSNSAMPNGIQPSSNQPCFWTQPSASQQSQGYSLQGQVSSSQCMTSPGPLLSQQAPWTTPANGQLQPIAQPSTAAQSLAGYVAQREYAVPVTGTQLYQYPNQQQQQQAGMYVQTQQQNLLRPQISSPGGTITSRTRTPSGQAVSGVMYPQQQYAQTNQLTSNSGVYQPMSPMQNQNTSPHHQLPNVGGQSGNQQQQHYTQGQQRPPNPPQGYLSPNRPAAASPLHRPTLSPMTTPPPCSTGLTPPPTNFSLPVSQQQQQQSQGLLSVQGGSLQQLEQMVAPGSARSTGPNPFMTIVQQPQGSQTMTLQQNTAGTFTHMNFAKAATVSSSGSQPQQTNLVITVTPTKSAVPVGVSQNQGNVSSTDLRSVNQSIARDIQQLRQQIQQLRSVPQPDQPKIEELSVKLAALASQLKQNMNKQPIHTGSSTTPSGSQVRKISSIF